MLRLSKFFLLAGLLPAAWAQQSYPFFSPSPSPPLLVTATANSPFGQSSYCYWVVVVYPIGKSTPSSPSCLSNAIETSSVLISWSAASGASSYDVLRTTTPVLPNVTSSIAVATAVSGTTQTDSFGALSSYTISSAVPATANLYLDNTAFSTPQLRAIVTGVDGTTAFNLGSGGGGTPGGANGQIQFNNAGAFGGFTVSGDATLNTGTGVLTVGNGAITNAKLANSSTTVNGQTCTLGSTCNANSGAAAHSVALNEGAGVALAAATIGTAGRLLIDQGAGADPSFNAASGQATITSAGVVTLTGSPTFTGTVTAPAFAGNGSNAFINLPSNTSHSFSSGDFLNNAGILQFNDGTATRDVMTSTNTSTTASQVPHATATAGVYTVSSIVAGDLPATVVLNNQANTYTGGATQAFGDSRVTLSRTSGGTAFQVTTTESGTFVTPIIFQDSGLTAGQQVSIALGQAASTRNEASFGFTFQGSGSTSNSFDWAFFGTARFMQLFASGNVTMGSNGSDNGFKLEVDGTQFFNGIPKFGGTNTTGSTAFAPGGSNCPAVSCTTPYTWLQAISSDGSTVFIPVWK